MYRIYLIFIVLSFSSPVFAEEYMTLRSDEVYMRYGPSTDNPIKWVYNKKGWPMAVQNRFDQWLKVRDISGEEGWIHKSLLSSRDYAIIQSGSERGYAVLRKKSKLDSSGIARIEDGGLVRVHECEDFVCKVSMSSFKGYLEKKVLWGIVQSK